MSSSTPLYDNDNSSHTGNCIWTISVTDCFGQEYFQVVYGVTIYLSLFVFLCSVWLLSWRFYSRQGTKLFSMKGFLTLEGYLFIQIFWGAARVVSCLILVYNWFPGQWIIREVIMDVTWFLGLISVATYLAGVLRTIPRMHFYRQNPHYKHALHLPNLRGIAGVYVTYVVVLGIIRLTCVVLMGYFRQYPTEDSAKIINSLMVLYYCSCSISTLLVSVGFIVYGNKLVEIASEGLHLLENVSGYPSSPRKSHFTKKSTYSGLEAELELKHKKLRRSVIKMRVINVAFILSFVGLAVATGVFAFFNKVIFEDIEISKMFATIANWMPMILNISVMAGIAYGEMRVPDKSEPRFDNLVIPTAPTPNTSQFTMERISSEAGSSFHSRNSSTDSDAPLLRWPAPVATVSTRRGSAQLDSPPSVTSSTSAFGGVFPTWQPSTPNEEDATLLLP